MKEWLDPLGDFIGSVGFPVALIVFVVFGVRRVVLWFKPHVESMFQRHYKLIDNLCERTETDVSQHKQTLKCFDHLGNAVHAAAPSENKPHVAPHIEQLRQETRRAEE